MDPASVPDLEWAVYIDEEGGGEYFYNRVNQETQWDPPAEYLDWLVSVVTTYLRSADSPWRIAKNGAKIYFYNKNTKKSSWKRPEELDGIYNFLVALTQQRRDDFDAQDVGGSGSVGDKDKEELASEGEEEGAAIDDDSLWQSEAALEDAVDYSEGGSAMDIMYQQRTAQDISREDEGPDASPDVVDMTALERKLDATDSIMETDVFETIEKFLKHSDAKPEDIVTKLKNSYHGYAKITDILLQWCDVRGTAPSQDRQEAPVTDNSAVKEVLYDLLSKLIKQKFDKNLADSLIRADSAVPSWLTAMMSDPVWRKLLIELLDSNRGSALLGYCLRQISAMGHHKEIGQTIRDADYFLVFNNLLQDFLVKICISSEEDIYTRTIDLTRMCCNCDYLFLYAQNFLKVVETRLLLSIDKDENKKRKFDDNTDTDVGGGKRRKGDGDLIVFVASRICRVRQDVERCVVWRSSTANTTTDSTCIDNTLLSAEMDKAKLEMKLYFSLRLTSFFPQLFNSNEGICREIADILREGVVEELHVKRLAQHLFGICDRDEAVLFSEGEIAHLTKNALPVVDFLEHYQIFSYLLDSLIHPTKRLSSPSAHRRSAALIVATILFKEKVSLAHGSQFCDDFNLMLTDVLGSCSLFLEILTMEFAGEAVLDKCETLILMIRKHRVVSLATLRWLGHSMSDNSFVSSPSYAALSPMLLQFVVTSAEKYPSQHPDCFAITKLMYKNKAKFEDSDSGRSVEIVSIKRDIVDSMIFLIGCGYISLPLTYLATEVKVCDAAVARHIVVSLLESFSCPIDESFANQILSIVLSVHTRKALLSKYFDEKKGPTLIRSFCDHASKIAGVNDMLISQLLNVSL